MNIVARSHGYQQPAFVDLTRLRRNGRQQRLDDLQLDVVVVEVVTPTDRLYCLLLHI